MEEQERTKREEEAARWEAEAEERAKELAEAETREPEREPVHV